MTSLLSSRCLPTWANDIKYEFALMFEKYSFVMSLIYCSILDLKSSFVSSIFALSEVLIFAVIVISFADGVTTVTVAPIGRTSSI